VPDRQTDGWTDGQTDILPRHSPRYAYASHGKNREIFFTPSIFSADTGGDLVGISRSCLILVKLE